MSRRAPAPGIRPTPATHCPGGVCGTGPSLPPFGYVQPTTLSSVFPRGGPTAGGTSILLRGHGFRGFDPGALCEFGALLGPVEFGSSQATAWAEGGGRLRDDAWRDDLRNTVALNCTAARSSFPFGRAPACPRRLLRARGHWLPSHRLGCSSAPPPQPPISPPVTIQARPHPCRWRNTRRCARGSAPRCAPPPACASDTTMSRRCAS